MQDSGRKMPAYRRLTVALRSAIEEGQFGDGERLPTEAELGKEHGVSRHTVRQAFQDLVADGLVYRVPGRGTFITGLSSRRGRYLRSVGTLEEMMTWAGTEGGWGGKGSRAGGRGPVRSPAQYSSPGPCAGAGLALPPVPPPADISAL